MPDNASIPLLKVIACLLNYPNEDGRQSRADITLLIVQAKEISPDLRAKLLDTVELIYEIDLMDAQEAYGALFDQGRSLSLHLFEHVHGESRDRGQAMVDLMSVYERNGFIIDARELPDYIPLFLEYLAQRPGSEAREWLADVSHILGRLGARLTEQQSPYAALFEALLQLAGRGDALTSQLASVAKEVPDNTPEALDKEWQETAVTFGPENPPDKRVCGNQPAADEVNQAQTLKWIETHKPVSSAKDVYTVAACIDAASSSTQGRDAGAKSEDQIITGKQS